ncbi:unnamed protein product [Clonostachys rosea]|uniref:Invertebrate defensins family profile domain-containing protein n=1 Tax=Bionectria ochroleuca TaxID=29856 RepID=A0ABY6U8C3_BIOOC|nr:unnamed protein product [Clonostachys rosea]
MHFAKAIVSLFALSSFAAAQYGEDVGFAPREIAEAVHEEYLAARDEYIEKRELFRRLGGNGTCRNSGKGHMRCYRNNLMCGNCRPTAKHGEYCLCNP